jgi:hypothetical protein
MAVEPLAATAFPRPRWPSRTAALLDLDPELGAALSPERFARARAELVVRILSLPRGGRAMGCRRSANRTSGC